ncbi:MAG TPA: ferric reductase-like transmembrane domain-containing protein [Caldilinea sp.]|nr:ferric reductase-like transmembrane domain-containing protein [Caldilinea sp.]
MAMQTTAVPRRTAGFRKIVINGAIASALLAAFYAASLLLERQGLELDNESVWYAIRASGAVAYLLLAASTAWGILLSGKLVKRRVPAALALELHTILSWTAIGMSVYHAYLLLFGRFFDYTVVDLLVPFVGPYEPLAVGLGIVGLYLMILTSASFYLIDRIGYRSFRQVHYLTYIAYVLATVHSVLAGSDGLLFNPVYVAVSAGLFLLTLARILARRPHAPRRIYTS